MMEMFVSGSFDSFKIDYSVTSPKSKSDLKYISSY